MLQSNQLQQLTTRCPHQIAELQTFFRNASLPLNVADSLSTLASRIQNERSFRRDLISHLWIISHTDVPPMPLPELLGVLTVAAAGVHYAANATDADAHALLRFLMESRRSFESATATSPVIPIRSAPVAAPIAAPEIPALAFTPVLLNRQQPVPFQNHSDFDADEELRTDRRPLIGVIVAACLLIGVCMVLWLRHPSAPQNAAVIAPSTQPAAAIVEPEASPATSAGLTPTHVPGAQAPTAPPRIVTSTTPRTSATTQKPSPLIATDATPSSAAPRNSTPTPRTSARAVSQSPQPATNPATRRSATNRTTSTPAASSPSATPYIAKVQPIDLGTEAEGTQPTATAARATVRPVSLGIMAANVTYSPAPAYPQAASAAHVQGEVKVEAEVGTDGNVTSARVISGPPLLREAALSAVERWRYRPYMAEGKPITMSALIVMDFQLP